MHGLCIDMKNVSCRPNVDGGIDIGKYDEAQLPVADWDVDIETEPIGAMDIDSVLDQGVQICMYSPDDITDEQGESGKLDNLSVLLLAEEEQAINACISLMPNPSPIMQDQFGGGADFTCSTKVFQLSGDMQLAHRAMQHIGPVQPDIRIESFPELVSYGNAHKVMDIFLKPEGTSNIDWFRGLQEKYDPFWNTNATWKFFKPSWIEFMSKWDTP